MKSQSPFLQMADFICRLSCTCSFFYFKTAFCMCVCARSGRILPIPLCLPLEMVQVPECWCMVLAGKLLPLGSTAHSGFCSSIAHPSNLHYIHCERLKPVVLTHANWTSLFLLKSTSRSFFTLHLAAHLSFAPVGRILRMLDISFSHSSSTTQGYSR